MVFKELQPVLPSTRVTRAILVIRAFLVRLVPLVKRGK